MRPSLVPLIRRATAPSPSTLTASRTTLPPLAAKPIISVRTMSSGSPASPAAAGRSRSPVRVPGPVETSIQSKLIEAFEPVLIRIYNDSSKHSHHAAMRAQGGGSGESHFAVHLVSPVFKGKTTIARHRLVNALLKDEFDQGLHALSLRLKTPEEWEKEGGGEMR